MTFALRRGNLLLSAALVGLLATGGTASAADPTYQFNIPAEPLSQALTDFSQASSQQIIYSEGLVRGRKSAGLHGTFSAGQALSALLAGTDLKAETNSAGVLMVRSKNAQAASNEGAANSSSSGLVETVVVTGTQLRNVESITPLITLSHDDLQKQGYTRLDQALQQLPMNSKGGVAVEDNAETGFGENAGYNLSFASGVNLRGLGTNATLVLLNGRPLPAASYGFSTDISAIPVSVIDRVEILTDGASATYGADAVAGVVNIITRKDFSGYEVGLRLSSISDGKAPNFGGSITAGFDWDSGNLVLNYDYEKDNPLFARNRSFTSGVTDPTMILPREENGSYFGSLRQEINGALTFSSDILYSTRDNYAFKSYPSYQLLVEGTVSQFNGSAQLDYAIGGDWVTSLSGQFGQERDNGRGSEPSNLHPIRFGNEVWSAELRTDGTLFSLPAGPVKVAIGGLVRGESSNSALTGSPATSRSRHTQSLYGEILIPLLDESSGLPFAKSLNLDIAGRYDHYSDFGGAFNPKYSLRLDASDELAIHGSYSTSFRAPPLYLLDPNSNNYGYVMDVPDPASPSGSIQALLLYISGPYLRPETARSYTAGATYLPEWVPGLKVEASYFDIAFRNKLENLAGAGFFTNVVTQAAILGPLVNLSPTPGQINAELNVPGRTYYNFSSEPTYDASTIKAIANIGWVNAATSHPTGIDLSARYDRDTSLGHFYLDGSGSYFLTFEEQVTPASATYVAFNTPYQPLRFRGKFSVGWDWNGIASYARVNYANSYHNPADTSCSGLPAGCPVSSSTTVDFGISYSAPDDATSLMRGMRVALDVSNVFDTNPPFVLDPSGHNNYDPVNANALKRAFALSVTKKF